MAQVPYAGGVSDVTPDARPPDDTQRVEATPASFGGLIAQGAEKLGAGAVDLSKFWGKVQSQDASNNAEKEASDLLVHAKSLQGQDALDQQQTILKNLDAIRDKYRDQLSTPESQAQYDATVTPYYNRFIRGNLDTHFVDQGKVVASKVNADSYNNAMSMAATAGSDGNWPSVEVARAKAFMAAKTDAVQKGLWNNPDVQQSAEQRANSAYGSAIEARALTNPDEAWSRIQTPKVKSQLGDDYDKVFRSVQETVAKAYVSKADAMEATDPTKVEDFVKANADKFGPMAGAALLKAHQAVQRAQGQAGGAQLWDSTPTPGARVTDVNDPGAQPGYSYEKAAFGHESSGNAGIVNNTPYTDAHGVYHPQGTGASGLFQFEPKTARGVQSAHPELNLSGEWWHDASPEGIAMQKRAFAAFTSDNRAYLQKNGIEPNDKNAFMASFLGAGGATKFIKAAQENPNANAAALFPEEAAANAKVFYAGGPGGSTPRTLAQVYALMTQKFSGKATIAPGMAPPPVDGDFLQSGNARPFDDASATPETPKPEDAAFNPTAPVAPPPPEPQSQEDILNAIYARRDAALQGVPGLGLGPEAQEEAVRAIQSKANFAIAAAGEQAREIKAREDEASNDVLGSTRNGDFKGAYAKLNAYMTDPRKPISEKAYDTLSDVIAKRSGLENPLSMGPHFDEVFDRMLLPAGDPRKIGDPMDILEAERRGEVSSKGADVLIKKLATIHKSLDDYGYEKNNSSFLSEMKTKFLKEAAYPGDTAIDPKGQAKFNDALVIWNTQFDQWRKARDEGKGPESFPLWERKNFDAFMESQYPQKERDNDRFNSQEALQPAPGTPIAIPPAPGGVNTDSWRTIISQVPIGSDKKPWPVEKWTAAVQNLRENPTPDNVSAFNRFFGPAGYSADEILNKLQKREAEPNRENQGAAQPSVPVWFGQP